MEKENENEESYSQIVKQIYPQETNKKRTVYFGLDVSCVKKKKSIGDNFKNLFKEGADFFIDNLCSYSDKEIFKKVNNFESANTLCRSYWNSSYIGKISPEIFKNINHKNREKMEKIFSDECDWANHLTVTILIELPIERLKNPLDDSLEMISNIINKCLIDKNINFWIKIPIYNEKFDTFSIWSRLKFLLNNQKKIAIVLEITENLPNPLDYIDWNQLMRWNGEPIVAIDISIKLFLNNCGIVSLSNPHQKCIADISIIHNNNFQYILTPTDNYGDDDENVFSLIEYTKYVEKLVQMSTGKITEIDNYIDPFNEYLQIPLQPLKDNLQNSTYECFEKDPIKYNYYENSMIFYMTQEDIMKKVLDKNYKFCIMVLGAGRGPIVKAIFKALHTIPYITPEIERTIKIYICEKNKNAFVTLTLLRNTVWKNKENIELIYKDMRLWTPPEKADVIVSELLGSFGDNELAPECLNNTIKFLKDDGISIPSTSTSYICPINCHEIYLKYKTLEKLKKKYAESPSVCKLQKYYCIDKPQEVFHFEYPKDKNGFGRFKKIIFEVKHNTLLSAFAGYFHSTLYKEMFISILPEKHTKNMFSWFPIIFPLLEPIFCLKGDKISFSIWRKYNEEKVWYEWSVNVGSIQTKIYNSNGKKYYIAK